MTKEIIIFVKPRQKSCTIKCPFCGSNTKLSCQAGVADCMDFRTCRECGNQFGWQTKIKAAGSKK